MGELAGMVALAVSVIGFTAFTAWWLDRLIKREADALHGRAEEHDKKLCIASAEIQLTRREVARLQSEVTFVRTELESFIHGPPSLRKPPILVS